MQPGPLEDSGLGPNVQKEILRNMKKARETMQANRRAMRKLRQIAKKANAERRRARSRTLERYRYAERRPVEMIGKHRLAGDTEFSLMARMTGLPVKELAVVMSLHPDSIYRWHGCPVHRWPAAFLRTYLWAKKMEAALIDRGVDTEAMKPVLDQPYLKNGRYPRKNPA